MAYRKGLVLTFGMVNVIVSADGLKESDKGLVSVCCGPLGAEHDPTQIKQQLHCSTCDSVVAYSDLKKARIVGTDFEVADQQEVATAKDSVLGATKKMMVVTMHPAADVVTQVLPGDGGYLLSPEGNAQIGAYSLMLDTIERHPEIAFNVRWTPSSKVNDYRLVVFGGALTMQELCSPEKVKRIPDLGVLEALPEHQAMMDMLIPTMLAPYDPALYADQSAAALEALMASKQAVSGIVLEKNKTTAVAPVAGGVDLTAALAAMSAAMLGTAAPAPKKRTTKTSTKVAV